MFFKQLYQECAIPNNPMALIDMTKKDNYLAAQNKESKPQCDLVVVFTDEELELIREEAFKRFANGKPAEKYYFQCGGYQQGKINEIDLQEKYVKDFIAKAKEYINIEKLTPEILRAFIKRIDVYEKEVRYSRICGNTIVIQYTFQLGKN